MNRLQLIFDTCSRHLLTQKEKSQEFCNCCYYKQKADGTVLMCGAAPVLDPDFLLLHKDEEIIVESDGETRALNISAIQNIVKHYPESAFSPEFQNLTERELSLLRRIQNVHDDEPVEEWSRRLGYVAETYNLDPSVLQE